MCLAASSMKGNDDVRRSFLLLATPVYISTPAHVVVHVSPCVCSPTLCVYLHIFSVSLCRVKDGLAGVKEKCHVKRFGGEG